MGWTKTQKLLAAAVVGLPVLFVVALMLWLIRSKPPGEAADTTSVRAAQPPSSQPAKATHSISLNRVYEMPAVGFGSDPSQDWGNIPRGAQVFSGVGLQIDGVLSLWGRGIAEKQGVAPREEILGIPVNQKFASLYVYHATYYQSPPQSPVYDLVFRYEDSSSVTNEIQYETHVFDWYSTPNNIREPSAANSIVAWRGNFTAADGARHGLHFCLTEFVNPTPSVMVQSIDLYSAKGQSSGVILALTAGPSGLVHNKKAK